MLLCERSDLTDPGDLLHHCIAGKSLMSMDAYSIALIS
jgi:hypothetical protein